MSNSLTLPSTMQPSSPVPAQPAAPDVLDNAIAKSLAGQTATSSATSSGASANQLAAPDVLDTAIAKSLGYPAPASTPTIGAAPKQSFLSEAENLTQQGRAEHPIEAGIGDFSRNFKDLIVGGQSSMGKKSGVLNNPIIQAMASGPLAELAAGFGAAQAVEPAAGMTGDAAVSAGLEGSSAGAGSSAIPSYTQRGIDAVKSLTADSSNQVLEGLKALREEHPIVFKAAAKTLLGAVAGHELGDTAKGATLGIIWSLLNE